jgi:hypothetical protein
MFALLGKKGFEEKSSELSELLRRIERKIV